MAAAAAAVPSQPRLPAAGSLVSNVKPEMQQKADVSRPQSNDLQQTVEHAAVEANDVLGLRKSSACDDDSFSPVMTAAESLLFIAGLVLPLAMGREGRRARVDEVLARMGLARAADTVVGVRGIVSRTCVLECSRMDVSAAF